ncbi:hypothetical protein ES708_23865 [subsurface metagenome]
MLSWFGFHLPVGYRGNQGQMYEQHPLFPQIMDELPGCFEKGNRLDVTYGTADLHNGHIYIGLVSHFEDPSLDLIGDVRNNLDGTTEKSPLPLLPNHLLVDLPCGYRVDPLERGRGKSGVVPQI